MELGLALSIVGAAIASTVSGIGAARGVSIAGSAAAGVLSEEPEKFGNLIILVALPGTQGIYGFITGVLVLIKTGLLTGKVLPVTLTQGLTIFGICVFMSLVEWWSAIYQGKVCAAGVGIAAKRVEASMRGVVLGVLVETYAVLGLLIAILTLWFGVKLG